MATGQRRRNESEDKAKVVKSDWGDRILAAPAVLGLFETNGLTRSFVAKRPRQNS